MTPTRVDTKKLVTALAKAQDHIDQAHAVLAPYMAILTTAERQATPRALLTFPEAGRALSRAIANRPEIAAATDYDGEAVIEDLDNAAALTTVDEKLTELSQRIADTRLTWLAEAWMPSLAAYAVAKVRARTDGALRTVVEPMAAVFATRRGRTPRAERVADTKEPPAK